MGALVRYQHTRIPPPGYESVFDDEEIFPEITNERQRRFLYAVCACGRPSQAAEMAHVAIRQHYVWQVKDQTYRAAFDRAKLIAADRLEETAWYQAEANTRNSALLLMFLLNAYKPERFKYKYAPEVETPQSPAIEERTRQANERIMRLRREREGQSDP